MITFSTPPPFINDRNCYVIYVRRLFQFDLWIFHFIHSTALQYTARVCLQYELIAYHCIKYQHCIIFRYVVDENSTMIYPCISIQHTTKRRAKHSLFEVVIIHQPCVYNITYICRRDGRQTLFIYFNLVKTRPNYYEGPEVDEFESFFFFFNVLTILSQLNVFKIANGSKFYFVFLGTSFNNIFGHLLKL